MSVAPNLLAAGFGAQPGPKTAGGAMAVGFEALLGVLLTGEPAAQDGPSAQSAATAVPAAVAVPAQVGPAEAETKDGLEADAHETDAEPKATAEVRPDLLLAGLAVPVPVPAPVAPAPAPTVQTGSAPDASGVAAAMAGKAAAPKADILPQALPDGASEPPPAPSAPEPDIVSFAGPADPSAAPAIVQPGQALPTARPILAGALPTPAPQAQTPPADARVSAPQGAPASGSPSAAPSALDVGAAPAALAQAPAMEAAATPAAAKAPAPKDEEVAEAPPSAGPSKSRKSAATSGVDAAPSAKPAQPGLAARVVLDESAADARKDSQQDAQGQASPAAAISPSAQTHAAQATATVRGAPETVAHLAAQIVRKLDGRSTRFDVALNPIGLGHVDVRVEIGAGGKISAALAFDNPQAAADLRARSHELTQALEQAGLDLSGGISFDVASDQGRQNGRGLQQDDSGAAFRGRAFQAALEANDAADAAAPALVAYSRRAATGVDVRI